MNLRQLCAESAHTFPAVQLVAVISDAGIVEFFKKSEKMPAPPPEQFSKMTFQVSLIAMMIRDNEEYFGRFGYFSIHSKEYDTYFFDLPLKNSLLAVVLKVPYDHNEVVSKIPSVIRSHVK